MTALLSPSYSRSPASSLVAPTTGTSPAKLISRLPSLTQLCLTSRYSSSRPLSSTRSTVCPGIASGQDPFYCGLNPAWRPPPATHLAETKWGIQPRMTALD